MLKWFSIFLLVVVLSAVTACRRPLRVREIELAPDTPNPAEQSEEFYVIGPSDVLGVVVWKEPSVSGPVKVRPDGYITVPLVNEVRAAGLTTGKLREILQEKYKEFINAPFVTIRVEEISSSEIFLIGEVNKPGAYPVTGSDTVLQLITRAGGLTRFADKNDIRVVRRNENSIKEFIVDYRAILDGDVKQDILLRPGDRVIVP